MTVVACILSGLSSVLMLCPFLCIWLVLRDVLAALPDLSTVNVEAMTLYGWMALGLAVGGFLLFVSSFLFPFGCVPHGQKYAVSDTAPSGFALIRLFLPEQ